MAEDCGNSSAHITRWWWWWWRWWWCFRIGAPKRLATTVHRNRPRPITRPLRHRSRSSALFEVGDILSSASPSSTVINVRYLQSRSPHIGGTWQERADAFKKNHTLGLCVVVQSFGQHATWSSVRSRQDQQGSHWPQTPPPVLSPGKLL